MKYPIIDLEPIEEHWGCIWRDVEITYQPWKFFVERIESHRQFATIEAD